MANKTPDVLPLNVAIIGGGVVGVITALGLLDRGIRVKIYERANGWHEIGAAVSFTNLARTCMRRLDPRITTAFERAGGEDPGPYSRYWDGFNPQTKEVAEAAKSLFFEFPAHELGFQGCLRSRFLEEMTIDLPDDVVVFRRELAAIDDNISCDVVRLSFADGSLEEADLVIGCDGIWSKTRRLLLGSDTKALDPTFTNVNVYRALLPISHTSAAFGVEKGTQHCGHVGPDAKVLTYPIAGSTLSNVVIFARSDQARSDRNSTTEQVSRDEVAVKLQDWSPAVRELISCLPQTLTKWELFDMADHPAPTYAVHRVCIAGDAAHAASPFLGVGAGMGVEDALALATALQMAMTASLGTPRSQAISAALASYSAARMGRTQGLVKSARAMGDLYMWRSASSGQDPQKCAAEYKERFTQVWKLDVDALLTQIRDDFLRRTNT